MEVLFKFLGDEPVDNVITCMNFKLDKVVYFGYHEGIEEQKKRSDWEFLFLGANIDAVQEAARFGINANRAVEYTCDSVGTKKNFSALGKTVVCFRAAPTAACGSAISDDWKEEIEEDHKSRGKGRRGK